MASLTVLGTGIMFPSQMTFEAAEAIRSADVTLFNVGNHALAVAWLKENAKSHVDLYDFYGDGKSRQKTYDEMVNAIMGELRAGRDVAAAFYGHPGVFVGPGFQAIKDARKEGYDAQMLPGVSAVDCMFADLEFDPAVYGCAMVEASDYVLMERTYDPRMPLILWQAGVVGDISFNAKGHATAESEDMLKRRLLRDYAADHPIITYVAATLPGMTAKTRTATIGTLEKLELHASSTCLVPPVYSGNFDAELGEPFLELMRASIREEEAA
ncbi:SAM-dependent methyltransferase [Pseudooceanicola sp.]|uniref:SAM-dependent methyltransferase n=1 Tax=Pseudooceanicola sp. TaxID=1914328 RepID=UPI0035C6D0D6